MFLILLIQFHKSAQILGSNQFRIMFDLSGKLMFPLSKEEIQHNAEQVKILNQGKTLAEMFINYSRSIEVKLYSTFTNELVDKTKCTADMMRMFFNEIGFKCRERFSYDSELDHQGFKAEIERIVMNDQAVKFMPSFEAKVLTALEKDMDFESITEGN
ncbi:hypothetical protein TUBRATIS_23110 [Tubulinosema ratisbonensis]|uniref:Uncharacterized protein n=1 Tax=Tubulinosema ratisbonensis TaxID=291195 RepID=A0A437AJ80_9MICR|nr:hypothetical protein TUBRATIS_23110 [Tubulinosema ratisbonensis]